MDNDVQKVLNRMTGNSDILTKKVFRFVSHRDENNKFRSGRCKF